MRHRLALLLALLALPLTTSLSASVATGSGFAGRWKGVILFEEGRIELDIVARIAHPTDAGWKAVLDLPLVGVHDLEVDSVKVEGGGLQMKFDLGDGSGERTLDVQLSNDGEHMTGDILQGARVTPVRLKRADSPADARVVPVEVLAPGTASLQQRFQADHGDVRLLLLLSPS